MQTKIRPAGEADLPEITDIYADAVRHGTATYELIPPPLAEMAQRFEALKAGGYPFLVAEAGGPASPTMPMPARSVHGPHTASR